MQIVNLTPHAISLANAEGAIIKTFEPSGAIARVAVTAEVVGTVAGADIKKTVFGEVTGIPAPTEGTLYLVSTLVAQAAKRSDVISPDTGPTALRDAGQVRAVRAFQSF